MNKLTLITCFLLSICINKLSAQSIPAPTSMEVYMQKAESDTTNLYADTLFQANTKQFGKMVIVLADTFNINKIYVKIKSSSNSSGDLFNKAFTYTQSGVFSDGTSFERVLNVLYIGLGNFTGLNSFYGEAKLESSTGYQTLPATYSNTN